MTTAMRATENRILAKRVKGKFTTPVEDVAKVRVLSNGVVSVAGTPYRSDTAGYKPRDVVEAVNVQNKGNARYRARFGNTQTIVEGDTIVNQVAATATTTGADSVPIVVAVTPDTPFSVSDFVGDTFTGSVVYTVTNNSTGSVTVTISKSADWLTLSTTTMTLAPAASSTVTAEINGTVAAAKVKGVYVDMIIFNANNA